MRTALQLATPPLYGKDMRPSDGTVFQLEASSGGGFLMGSTCAPTSSSCIPIPTGIARLVADLRALDQQELTDASCSGTHK